MTWNLLAPLLALIGGVLLITWLAHWIDRRSDSD